MELKMLAYNSTKHKATISIAFTRQRSKFSKVGRAVQASFDPEQYSFEEIASRMIDALQDYVTNARLKRRVRNVSSHDSQGRDALLTDTKAD